MVVVVGGCWMRHHLGCAGLTLGWYRGRSMMRRVFYTIRLHSELDTVNPVRPVHMRTCYLFFPRCLCSGASRLRDVEQCWGRATPQAVCG